MWNLMRIGQLVINAWLWFYCIDICAQPIQIDSITVNENQNLLKISGVLTATPGVVLINGKNLTLIQWGDTGALYSLPPDGPGSSGQIKIIQDKDTIVGWSLQEWHAHISYSSFTSSSFFENSPPSWPRRKASEYQIYFRTVVKDKPNSSNVISFIPSTKSTYLWDCTFTQDYQKNTSRAYYSGSGSYQRMDTSSKTPQGIIVFGTFNVPHDSLFLTFPAPVGAKCKFEFWYEGHSPWSLLSADTTDFSFNLPPLHLQLNDSSIILPGIIKTDTTIMDIRFETTTIWDTIHAESPVADTTSSGINSKSPSPNLLQCFPNPISTSTTFFFPLSRPEFSSLKIYTPLGNEAATVINQILPAGNQHFEFDASQLPSGIYYYRLQIGDQAEAKPMIVLH
ncbi:MAG: T9SS type A sorting domain-containing protein [Ignavibacteriota bacterium]